MDQTGNGTVLDFESLAPQLTSQFAGGLARPLEAGDRVARGGILE